MRKKELIGELKEIVEYSKRSTKCLEKSNSDFAPKDAIFTVMHQVAHVAQTIDWFFEGAFNPNGFDLNFEKHDTGEKYANSLRMGASQRRALH